MPQRENQSDMTPAELRNIISEVYGARGGQIKAAADIERGVMTVNRWALGKTPVAPLEALFLRLVLVLHRKGINWRKWINDYKESAVVDMDDVI